MLELLYIYEEKFLDLSIFLLHFLKVRVWMTVHGIYYKKRCFRAFQKLLVLTGKKWQDNIGTRFWSEWEKFVIDIGEWLWHLSKYCPIFWSCLQFFLIGIIAGNWSVIKEYSWFSDISRSKSWVLWVFVLRMLIQKEEI